MRMFAFVLRVAVGGYQVLIRFTVEREKIRHMGNLLELNSSTEVLEHCAHKLHLQIVLV